MKVLGLSSNYHDASAALVIDGKIVAAAAEERFTLQKHDPSFPTHSAKFCLEQAGIEASELDLIAYHEDPEIKFSRTLSSAFERFPFSVKTFNKSMHEAITSGLWIRNQISDALQVDPRKIVCVPHHLSHAAHSFLASPYKDAAIVTVDAVGEWTCSAVFKGRKEGGKIHLEPAGVMPFPHSLGLVYSAFTAFLGFQVNDGECSTMALAAFGEPRYADAVRDIIRATEDGGYEVDVSYFDFSRWDDVPVTPKFIKRFGAPRTYGSKVGWDCLLGKDQEVSEDDRRFADVAASVQLVLEERVLALVAAAGRDCGSSNLCLSGGVALNCVANGKIIDAGLFKGFFVPPDPGDGGGALGAALYAALSAGETFHDQGFHPYFGKSYDCAEAVDILKRSKPAKWTRYLRPGYQYKPRTGLRVEEHSDPDAMISQVAGALADGKIVGWFQGRFENGPRALGNRSILCDPSRVDLARRLSRDIKLRAPFRPYACSVTAEAAKTLFENVDALPNRWMLASRPVRSDRTDSVRAALHTDLSTRPQVCHAAENPRFHALLTEFGRRKGTAALLNTSFNERGFPMVASPLDASLMFARTDLDVLVLDNTVITRED